MKQKVDTGKRVQTLVGPNLLVDLDCEYLKPDGHHRDAWVVVHRGRNVGISTPFRMVVLTRQVDGIPLTPDQLQWISGILPEIEDWCCQWEHYSAGQTYDWATPQACVAQ